MFQKILIANRGEIACRVATTARRLGIRTVAVYSDADASAKHVAACDEAVHIGGSAPRDSYLQWQRILQAAQATGAQAVHPGYGFLSENDAFAQACADAGLVFIGPTPAAIRAMGLKAESKQLMATAGVPLVPGYHGADQDPALLQREADSIGYPVLIKASAGGGGKGMRAVERSDDFAAALERWPERHRKITGRSPGVTPAAIRSATKFWLRPPAVFHSMNTTCRPKLERSGTPTQFHSAAVRTSTSTDSGFSASSFQLSCGVISPA